MGLYRRIPRELRANRLRYLALFFLVALGMYVVVGLVGAADTIIRAVDHSAVQNRREDGQFTVFAPLSGAQLLALEQAGATVEAMPYLDYAGEGGSVLRVFQTRQHIDLTQADTGTLPNVGEVLLEKLYANAHGLAAGDVLSIGGTALTVSGTGTSPDYDAPLQNLTDVAQDSHRFGTVFVDPADYLALRASGQSLQSETCLYAYRLGGGLTHGALKQMLRGFTIDRAAITDTYFLELLDELDEPKNELLDGVEKLVDGGASLNGALAALGVAGDDLLAAFQEAGLPPQLLQPLAEYLAVVNAAERGGAQLQSGLDELQRQAEDLAGEVFGYDIENLTSFVEAKDNPRVAASAADVVINKNGGIMAGIIALVLFAYVISVFTVHSIDSDSEVIGTLYALGAPRGALVRHYLALPVLVAGLGGMAGTALGFSPLGVAYQMRDTAGYFSFPTPAAYTPLYLLIYGLAMPPLVAALVNFLVVRSRLARPPLALLRKEHAKEKSGGVQLVGMGFIGLFRLRQFLREKRAGLAVCGGMFIALLLLILGLNCYAFITTMQRQNKADIQYNYMVSLKYPPKDVPKGATAVYMQSLSREIYGYEMDVTVLGIGADNPYFDFIPAAGEKTLTISTSMANKFHLHAGDDVVLADRVNDKRYVFTVDKVVPYSVGLYAFMDISSMRNLFGAAEEEYNVLLANTMPDIDAGRIYAVTSRAGILEYGNVFLRLMTPMVVMMVSVATVVFAIVMYLMMKMMVDRSSFGISLMKIFGFSDGEVRKLYLDGNFITVALSALIGVPLAKLVMNAVYPQLIANVALGPDMAMPAWLYAAIFALIFGCYLLVSLLLSRRLKKVTPAEVLKRRE